MTHDITLGPTSRAILDELLATDRFRDANEVMSHALGALADEAAMLDPARVAWRRQIEAGLADIAAGRTVDAEGVFAELRRTIATRRGDRDAAE